MATGINNWGAGQWEDANKMVYFSPSYYFPTSAEAAAAAAADSANLCILNGYALLLVMAVFWVVAPCSLVEV
jgi:hypothetical protein